MFQVTRAKLNVTAADHISAEAKLATINALVCTRCGYGHLGKPEDPEPKDHVCDHCGEPFTPESRVNELYRIETVETKVRERISVNDEERQRQGYDIITTYRFLPGPGGGPEKEEADVTTGNRVIARLTYSQSASLWRINRGWTRRKDKNQLGFHINPLTGQWSKEEPDGEEDENGEAKENKVASQRIVPFVEDRRNILIVTPPENTMEKEAMATAQAALKRGIEQTFQIESAELIVEALPSPGDRRSLLLYEAAEGGAGVLSRLASDPSQLAQVARAALSLMHYEVTDGPVSSSVLKDMAGAEAGSGAIPCEAGCYQCLLSYFNQPDHAIINRRNAEAVSFLAALANATVQPLQRVKSSSVQDCDNNVTTPLDQWLATLSSQGLRQPDKVKVPVNGGEAHADALYQASRALVFLSPPTETVFAYARDRGFTVITFPSDASSWPDLFAQHPSIFGTSPANS